MAKTRSTIILIAVFSIFTACKKDKDPIIIVPPSGGVEDIVFQGNTNELSGANAGNAVYLDLSTNKMVNVPRAGWDLGFYSGDKFRVVLNNTSSAGAIVLDKFDLTKVGAQDTIGQVLTFDHNEPLATDLAFYDDLSGDLTKTLIPAIATDDNSNPVIILNRGNGGGIADRPWVKLRILQNGNGYTLQYAGIKETTYKTLNIAKDPNADFQLVSIDNGILNDVPQKGQWDLVWSYSVFETDFGDGVVPYNFSDLIGLNYLDGVQVKQMVYADADAASLAYDAFNKDSVAIHPTEAGRWGIGSAWRSTFPATGARQDRFYLIKDADGNYYKFKALAMGVNDGGVRGNPEFKYALIPN